MREEDVDKILRSKISDEIKAPESLKSRISYEINNMGEKNNKNNKKTKLRVIQSIAAVAVFSILGVTTYGVVTKNPILEKLGLIKGSATYEEVSKDINQDLSNEYAKITLKRMASDNAYIIMQYNVDLNENGIEKFGKIEKSIFSGYDISINNSIKINDREIDMAVDRTEYVNRISDTEYDIYQIIKIANIDSKELKIEISERDLEAAEKQTYINKEIIINATKDENAETFKEIQKKVDNKTITVENFQNTSFETFIKVSIDIEDVNKEDVDDFYSEKNPNNMSFAVLDSNNNYVPHMSYMKKSILQDEAGNELDILAGYEYDNNLSFKNTTAHLEYIITLGDINKDISEFKLIPFIKIIQNERTTNTDEYYDNLKWYKLQSGEYKQKNSLGGEIELTKIEVDDEKIKFAYILTGFITGGEDMVLVRITDERLGFNVIYPTSTYIQNIDSEENSVEFNRDIQNVGEYSANFQDDEDFKLKDISKIEFALLGEPIIKLIDAEIDLKLPEKAENYLTINNIEVKEIENYDETDETIELPNDNAINEEINNTETIEKEISELEPKVFGENDNFMGDIQLGMTERDVKAILGEPDGIVSDEETEIKSQFSYRYNSMEIVFVVDNGESIVELINLINNTNVDNKGPRGISIGDTKEDVINSFYCEDEIVVKDEYETDLYRFDNEGYVGHILNDNGYEKIQYYGDFLVFDVCLDINGNVVIMTLQRAQDGY